MQVSACLHPKVVLNQYTGDFVQVPCGVCDACLSVRPLGYVARLKHARELYRDSIFCTFTYNNDFVPRGVLTEHFVFHSIDLVDDGHNFAKLADYFEPKLVKYINAYEQELGFIPLLCRSDIRRFIQQVKKQYTDIMWFVCGEYGPTTLRPHYHALFFINPRAIEREIDIDSFASFLCDTWNTSLRDNCKGLAPKELGNVRLRYDSSSSAEYTARYLNCTSHIPHLLKSVFSPFASYGRNLSLPAGFDYNKVRELLYSGSCETFKYEYVNKQRVRTSCLLPKSVLLRYFPAFRGCGHFLGTAIYNAIMYACSFGTASQFLEDFSLLREYRMPLYKALCAEWKTEMIDLDSIKYFYYACKTMKKIARDYGVNFRHYLYVYDLVINKIYPLNQLREFYELQQQIADDAFLDVRFINSLYVTEAVPFPDAPIEFRKLENNPLFQRFKVLCKKIALDTTKTKKRNDYISSLSI